MTNLNMMSENDNSTVLTEYKGLNKTETFYQSEDALEKELIKTLVNQGYEYITINSENDFIANLRKQLEKLNHYHFTDSEWDIFFTNVIANDSLDFPCGLSLKFSIATLWLPDLEYYRDTMEPIYPDIEVSSGDALDKAFEIISSGGIKSFRKGK